VITTPTEQDITEIEAQASVIPECKFVHDGGTDDAAPPRDAWWMFGEIMRDGGNKRPIYLYAPAEIVDETSPHRFADAVVSAHNDRAAIVADVRRLRLALTEALDEFDDALGYVPAWAMDKWGYRETVARLRKVQGGAPSAEPAPTVKAGEEQP